MKNGTLPPFKCEFVDEADVYFCCLYLLLAESDSSIHMLFAE